MTGIEKYNEIYDMLNEKIKNDEYTIEQAEVLNQAAYEMYVLEAADDENAEDEEQTCDCGKEDCPICNPDSEATEEPKKKSIKKKDEDSEEEEAEGDEPEEPKKSIKKKAEDEEEPEEDEDAPKKKSIKKKDEDSEDEEIETPDEDGNAKECGDGCNCKKESAEAILNTKIDLFNAYESGSITSDELEFFLTILD